MAKPAAKPAFGAGILSGLRATAGAVGGEPLFLPLDQVEEDPDQPRTTFDEAELEQLAETIRLYGVLTPVGVRRLEGDRYRLVYGARRLRASRLAGQTRIPATILPEGKSVVVIQGVFQHINFWLLDPATGRLRQLTNLKPEFDMKSFDVSPDGKQILCDRDHENSDIVLIDLPPR